MYDGESFKKLICEISDFEVVILSPRETTISFDSGVELRRKSDESVY